MFRDRSVMDDYLPAETEIFTVFLAITKRFSVVKMRRISPQKLRNDRDFYEN